MPDPSIDRLYDTTNGFKAIVNISDFIGYSYPNIFYLECKSHLGNTFPLANLTQYDKLTTKVGIKGVRVGVIKTHGQIGTIFPDAKQPTKKGTKK